MTAPPSHFLRDRYLSSVNMGPALCGFLSPTSMGLRVASLSKETGCECMSIIK